ncbi:SCO1431 family membrane protein [Streptomyces sp. NPDC006259]|uniref:SCO1431 family membrane protein n=1 Tax=Streptomyces sp. NPDC006259 TaxID=3364740 RepID=UPI0036CAB11F
MSKLSAAKAPHGGKVDGSGKPAAHRPHDRQRDAMTAHTASATAARTRTGGPEDDGPKILEHVMGWILVAVVAMLVTQLGLV